MIVVAKTFGTTIGGLVAVGLMLTAAWAWFTAAPAAQLTDNGELAKWAARCLAIAAAAGAQIVLLTFVVGRVYTLRPAHDGLRLAAGVVCCVATVTAAALGLAAKG